MRRNRPIPDNETYINRSTYLKKHGQHGDPPSVADGLVEILEVVRVVTVDLHLNESNKEESYLKETFRANVITEKYVCQRIKQCVFCTSRGYFIPFRLCSDPSDVALQRPQWKLILSTRNLELRPPPLTKKSPSTLMVTKAHTCTSV